MAGSAPSPVYVLRGAGSPVTALDFTEPGGDCLLTGGQNGQIHLWDMASRRIKCSFDWHSGQPILFLKATHRAQSLMTQGRDGHFNMWKHCGPDYVLEGRLKVDGEGFCSAVLLPQAHGSHLVALPGKDSAIHLYDEVSLTLVHTLHTPSAHKHLGLCMCMCAVPNSAGTGPRLMAGYESGALVLWDVTAGKVLHQWVAHDDAVMCVTYSSSAKLNKGFSGSVDERLGAWRVTDEDKIEPVRKIECTNPGFNDVRLRPDGKILATAGWDNHVRVFSAKSLRPLAVLAYHRDTVSCVQFSQDNMLAVGSKDQLVSVWDIYRTD